MDEQRARATSARGGDSPPEAAELPTERAFVLQLSRETGPTLEPFTGRVEHLATGCRLRFENFAAFRAAYVSDKGYDGAGWGPADTPSREGPALTYEANLADGTKLSGQEVVKRFGKPMRSAPSFSVDEWYKLVDNKDDNPCMTPATAPACPNSQFELFRDMTYTVAGAFMKPQERAKITLATEMEGGGDPTTAYMINYISRTIGPVYVFRAKLPTFPNTWANTKTMPDGQVKYWSVATVASAPSGGLWDGVFDMQVSVDKHGYYTIVVSRPEDRPKNATSENGVTWIDWGPGEGLDDPRNRKDWGMLLMRYLAPHKDWQHNPLKATKPGMEAAVMGPYYPRGYYTTKSKFEAKGPRPAQPPMAVEVKHMNSNRASPAKPHHVQTVLLGVVLVSIAACSATSISSSEGPQLMFVQSAEDLTVDQASSSFRLVKVNQQTLYFSDRPQRLAGHLKMADYLKTWKEGRDNFGADPPNATLSVYEPGRADQTPWWSPSPTRS